MRSFPQTFEIPTPPLRDFMSNGEGQHFFEFKSFFGVLRGTRALSSHVNLSRSSADWLDFLSFFLVAFALCLLLGLSIAKFSKINLIYSK